MREEFVVPVRYKTSKLGITIASEQLYAVGRHGGESVVEILSHESHFACPG